jgi:AmmeMemoRadiSam system protein B
MSTTAISPCPRLRPLEVFPVGDPKKELLFALRDPDGFSDTVVLPYPAAVLATLMDGRRRLSEIQTDFQLQFGQPVPLLDLERFIGELDQANLLDSDGFRQRWQTEVQMYLNNPVRPAAHAGGAYAGEPGELRQQLERLFLGADGPGAINGQTAGHAGSGTQDADSRPMPPGGERLCGVLSPHIDLHRGGAAFAWAYKRVVEESGADIFVIFGTAHNPMRQMFSVSRKNFATPLGTAQVSQPFVDRLVQHLIGDPRAEGLDLFQDELAHRHEHSIEFQALFLQYVLGDRRPYMIVPVLTGSFHRFVERGREPAESPHVAAFVAAMQATAAEFPGRVCYISGGDLAHVGRRFGDEWLLDEARLAHRANDDKQLLTAACRADAAGFFQHIAVQADQSRICGLAPTYTMLQVMQPVRGELLKYDQAVEQDGSACVSFASAAFYR